MSFSVLWAFDAVFVSDGFVSLLCTKKQTNKKTEIQCIALIWLVLVFSLCVCECGCVCECVCVCVYDQLVLSVYLSVCSCMSNVIQLGLFYKFLA